MPELSIRCPRCKQTFSDDDVDRLADHLLAHVASEHGGHAPPREHVIQRITRHN